MAVSSSASARRCAPTSSGASRRHSPTRGPAAASTSRRCGRSVAAFRGKAKLQFAGEFYSFSLLTPMWSPGPMAYPDPPIYAAGVHEWMCRMIGEVADGLLVHPLNTNAYLDEVVEPAVRRGEDAAGRPPGSVRMVCPVMTAVSDNEEVRQQQRDSIRGRPAFYGSTPGYGVVFDASGWPGTGERLNALQRQGDVQAMKDTITDEMVEHVRRHLDLGRVTGQAS